MPLRIAQLTPSFPPYYAGAGNACFYQAEALARRGHDLTVFTAVYPGEPVDPEGVEVVRYDPRVRLGNAPCIPQLAALSGFDLIHLHQPFIFGAEAALLAHWRTRIPLVSSFHNELQAEGLKGVMFRLYEQTVTRASLRCSARLTPLSLEHASETPLLARELARRPDQVVPVPNGIDPTVFYPGDETGLRRELGAEGHTLAIFCAKLDAAHRTKRLDLALRAVAEAGERNLLLAIVGGGPLEEEFRELGRELGIYSQLRFVGDTTHREIARYMRAADFLIMPSVLESFGIVQIEAMACARPVVISRLSGARGVSIDGLHGFHVEPGSLEDLTRGLRQMLALSSSEREAMGRACRAHVLEHYTWDRTAELLEQVYFSIPGLGTLNSRR